MAEQLHDDRELLALLRLELGFLEDGGYGRSVHTPWRPTILLRDSPSCLNFAMDQRPHPCSACWLTQFVPAEQQVGAFPCHHIPLNEKGESIDSLYDDVPRALIEEKVAVW